MQSHCDQLTHSYLLVFAHCPVQGSSQFTAVLVYVTILSPILSDIFFVK